jgi:hypothetical protein
MGRKFSNIMMLSATAMLGSTTVTPSFNTSFDYTNNPSMNNSKKHKAKVKKANAKRNRKR